MVGNPRHCVCGTPFSTDHAMTCKHGSPTIMRHNEIHDITANLLSEVCHGVERQPPLQPLTGETILPQTANRQDDAGDDSNVHFLTQGFFPLNV